MYLTDPIGDMLTRIRNAANVKAETVDIPSSGMKRTIADVLLQEGYISKVENLTKMNKKIIRITLKYGKKKISAISVIKRVSTPGKRTYVGKDSIPRLRAGFGTVILTTPKGVITDSEARKLGVGGEIICYIW